MKKTLFGILLAVSSSSVLGQDLNQRLECFNIPWKDEPSWEYTADEIRTHEFNFRKTITDKAFIDSLMYWLNTENLNPIEGRGLRPRMVIDYYANDSLTSTIVIGKPFFRPGAEYYLYSTSASPPFVLFDGSQAFGLFWVEIDNVDYHTKYEFGKFILKHFPITQWREH